MIIFSNSISNKIFTFDYRDPSCMNDFVKGKLIVEKFCKMLSKMVTNAQLQEAKKVIFEVIAKTKAYHNNIVFKLN